MKMEKLNKRFTLLTDNEQVSMETLLSAEWVHGIEYGFDDVRYDEPPEEILYSQEALSGLLIEEEGTLYHESHSTSKIEKSDSTPPASPSNGLMTEKEVAERLGVSWWTVRGWRVKGNLPFIRLKPPSRRIFYRMETVLEWLHQREVDAVVKHQEAETQFVSVI